MTGRVARPLARRWTVPVICKLSAAQCDVGLMSEMAELGRRKVRLQLYVRI